MSSRTIKRFYQQAMSATVVGGYGVELDGRPIRTPGKAPLVLPSLALAEALAAEWAAQVEVVEPEAMALTSLACTAIDRVRPRRDEVAGEVADYGRTDGLCYRADRPPDLVARQDATWQPLLDWAALALDAPLTATTGILLVDHPDSSLAALGRAVAAHDDLELAALASAVKASGSLIIALALSHGRIDPEGAFQAAELHESHQIELWGDDPEAARRRASVRVDLDAAGLFLTLLRS
jgi:chaperone required for assembly of F1-ATPase